MARGLPGPRDRGRRAELRVLRRPGSGLHLPVRRGWAGCGGPRGSGARAGEASWGPLRTSRRFARVPRPSRRSRGGGTSGSGSRRRMNGSTGGCLPRRRRDAGRGRGGLKPMVSAQRPRAGAGSDGAPREPGRRAGPGGWDAPRFELIVGWMGGEDPGPVLDRAGDSRRRRSRSTGTSCRLRGPGTGSRRRGGVAAGLPRRRLRPVAPGY